MKKNMGTTDKTIRIVIALTIAVLYFTNVINGILAIVLMAFAVIFIVVSFIGVCPIYPLLGINTRKKEPTT